MGGSQIAGSLQSSTGEFPGLQGQKGRVYVSQLVDSTVFATPPLRKAALPVWLRGPGGPRLGRYLAGSRGRSRFAQGLILDPLQILGAARDYRAGGDLRGLVSVPALYERFQGGESLGRGLHGAHPLLGHLNITFPSIGAADGAQNLNAGGKPGIHHLPGQLLCLLDGFHGGGHLEKPIVCGSAGQIRR